MRKPAIWLTCLVFALSALAISGCGGDDNDTTSNDSAAPAPQGSDNGATGDDAASGGLAVEIGDNFFKPESLEVAAGDAVTWTNGGQVPHNVTADDESFASETLEPDATYKQAFDEAGEFKYACTIHSGQNGTITVK